MGNALHKLLSIASEPLCRNVEIQELSISAVNAQIGTELASVLSEKDGFFAFESALRVFPTSSSDLSYGLVEWNSEDLWRFAYGGLADNCYFFAEDIFGVQFCIKDDAIYAFDPETADLQLIGSSFGEWAAAILKDYNLLTGYSIAHEWQALRGALPSKQRLVPKIPFVLGGEFAVANLYAIDAIKGMRARGNLAQQIRDLPDGAKITFNLID